MMVVSESVLVVVSGLPASGKTTLGRAISQRLSMPLLDKDEILEALFDSLGCADFDERYRLSRASDEILYRISASAPAAVLVNWWSHDSAPARLLGLCDTIVEVFCDCPVEVAAARFAGRERHPGHLDQHRTPADQEAGIARMRESFPGPLRLGGVLITVDTSQPVDLDALGDEVRSALPELFRAGRAAVPPGN